MWEPHNQISANDSHHRVIKAPRKKKITSSRSRQKWSSWMQGVPTCTSGALRHFVQPCSATTTSSGYVWHPSRSETKGRVSEVGAPAVWSASSQQPGKP
ncbi:hypothetical protein V5799_005612 [Amblyomma americanum]|uniref:Uncharacterized protein n=1 Tax=Amblyomma americanum TaxID=6943 RepID=A0AAQ4DYR7_AMBAM